MKWVRAAVLLALAVGGLAAARAFGADAWLKPLEGWIASRGAWGPAAYIAAYAGLTVAGIPASALTLMAGALFGSARGVVFVSVASTAGAACAFLIARYLARDAVSKRLAAHPKLRELDRLTREQGAVIVAVTRLVPLFPFTLLNYGFGLTAVSFRTYLFWSWLCMLPGTILYVAAGDAVTSALRDGRIPWELAALIVASAILLAGLVRIARRRLKRSSEVERTGE